MHVNVKAPRHAVYETAEQAIQHVFMFGLYPQRDWLDVSFGRDLALIRKANEAIKAKDFAAFTASRRKGFWRVELAA